MLTIITHQALLYQQNSSTILSGKENAFQAHLKDTKYIKLLYLTEGEKNF